MFGHRNRDELYLIFEEIVQFPDYIFPIAEGDVGDLANIELFKVVFLFKTSGKDRIVGNIFD